MKNNKKPLVTVLSFTFAAAAYLIADSAMARELPKSTLIQATSKVERSIELSRKDNCGDYQAFIHS